MKRPILVVFPVLFLLRLAASSTPLALESTPPPQAGGPEPAHLVLCGGILMIIAVVTIVLFLRRRKERPRQVETEVALRGHVQPEGHSEARRSEPGVALAEPVQPEDASKARQAKKRRIPHSLAFTFNLLSRFFAFIFAMLFVIIAPLTLLLFNVGWQFFNPSLYKRALVEQHIYEKFPSLAAEQLAFQLAYAEKRAGVDTENMTASPELEACLRKALGDDAFNAIAGFEREADASEIERMRPCFAQYGEREGDGGGGPPPGLASLTPADYEAMLSILIPRAWMQAQAESVIDQAFASLDSDGPAPPITISLVELREHLDSGAVVEAFLYVVRSRPPCTDEQLALIASGPLQDLPTCRPPEDMLNSMAQEGTQILSEAIGKLPDEANLSETFRGQGESDEAPPAEGPSATTRARPCGGFGGA